MDLKSQITPVQTKGGNACVLHCGRSRMPDGLPVHRTETGTGINGLGKRLGHAVVIGKSAARAK